MVLITIQHESNAVIYTSIICWNPLWACFMFCRDRPKMPNSFQIRFFKYARSFDWGAYNLYNLNDINSDNYTASMSRSIHFK